LAYPAVSAARPYRWIALPRRKAAVTLPRDRRGLGIEPIEIFDHRGDRCVHVVDVKPEETDMFAGMQCGIVGAQPVDEVGDLDIAPHPLGKAPECGTTADMHGLMPDVAIDPRRIGPICLDCHDIESVPFDQPSGDLRPSAVELRGAVGCLTEQYDASLGEAIKHRAERRIVGFRQRLSGSANEVGRRGCTDGDGGPPGPQSLKRRRCVHGRLCPAGRADEGHEGDRSQILLVEAIFAIADDLHQFLDGANFTDRNDKTPANLELAPQCFRNFRTSCGDQDSIEGRRIGPPQSPVAMPHLDVGVLQALQRPPRAVREIAMPLDAEDLAGQSA
jgi:hypothetical protein